MAKSTRQFDSPIERLFCRFADEHLFNNKSLFSETKRTDDKESQLNGSDIIISMPSLGIHNAIVDEKCATHNINQNLKTYCFEISFKNRKGEIIEGWFIDSDNKTQYYLLGYPKSSREESGFIKDLQYDEITEVEYFLVKKQDIIKYLISLGLDDDKIYDDEQEWRKITSKEELRKKQNEMDKLYGFHYSYSFYLEEQPFNIILPKRILKKLSVFHSVIQK